MVLARYSAVSSGQVIPEKRPNDQQSELIGIKYLKQLVCVPARTKLLLHPLKIPR